MNPRSVRILGWCATATAVVMYGSFLDQIRLNLAGDKGSLLLPAAAAINCTLWAAYGWLRPGRDWPVMLANAPGIVLGIAAFATAL